MSTPHTKDTDPLVVKDPTSVYLRELPFAEAVKQFMKAPLFHIHAVKDLSSKLLEDLYSMSTANHRYIRIHIFPQWPIDLLLYPYFDGKVEVSLCRQDELIPQPKLLGFYKYDEEVDRFFAQVNSGRDIWNSTYLPQLLKWMVISAEFPMDD